MATFLPWLAASVSKKRPPRPPSPTNSPFTSSNTRLLLGTINYYRPTQPTGTYGAGTVRWCSPTGSDSAPGTQNAPFQTVTKLASVLQAGWTGYVGAGYYSEQVVIDGLTFASGTAGNPIVLASAPVSAGGGLGTATIHNPTFLAPGAQTADGIIKLKNVNYWTIDGLICSGTKGQANDPGVTGYSECGVSFNNFTDNCIVQNCITQNCLHCGIKDGQAEGTNQQIYGCGVYNNGYSVGVDHGIYMPSSGWIVDGCILVYNSSWGLHGYTDPASATGTRNIAAWNTYGILMAGNHCVFNYNVCYQNGFGKAYVLAHGTDGGNGFEFKDSTHDNVLLNNICQDNYSDAARPVYADMTVAANYPTTFPTNCDFSYCCTYPGVVYPGNGGNPAFAGTNGNTSGNCLNVDPLFVDPPNGDFRLQGGSPCIGTGFSAGHGTNMGCF